MLPQSNLMGLQIDFFVLAKDVFHAIIVACLRCFVTPLAVWCFKQQTLHSNFASQVNATCVVYDTTIQQYLQAF